MLSEELKNLVSQFGALVMVESGQPKFVVLSYDKFRSVIAATSSGVIHKDIDNSGDFDKNTDMARPIDQYPKTEEELVERLNKEILALKAEVAEKERELSGNL